MDGGRDGGNADDELAGERSGADKLVDADEAAIGSEVITVCSDLGLVSSEAMVGIDDVVETSGTLAPALLTVTVLAQGEAEVPAVVFPVAARFRLPLVLCLPTPTLVEEEPAAVEEMFFGDGAFSSFR